MKHSNHFIIQPLSGNLNNLQPSEPVQKHKSLFNKLFKLERQPQASEMHKNFSHIGRLLHQSVLGDLALQAINILKNPGEHFLSRRRLKQQLAETSASEIQSVQPMLNPYMDIPRVPSRTPKIK